MKSKVARFAGWVNDNIVGSPFALIGCMVFVACVFGLMAIQGYQAWNLSTGLFSNDIESAYELITGTASVVAVVALHKSHKAHVKSVNEHQVRHTKELIELRDKINSLKK